MKGFYTMFAILSGSYCSAQDTLLLSGFESWGSFDLDGVQSFCNVNMVTGSNDTPLGSSQWSAMIPPTFYDSCDWLINEGLIFPLEGLAPNELVRFHFWAKLTAGSLNVSLLYEQPPTGTLPNFPGDIGILGWGMGTSGPFSGEWEEYSPMLQPPGWFPPAADCYLLIQYFPDTLNPQPALLDEVGWIPDLNASIGIHGRPFSVPFVSPSVTSDFCYLQGSLPNALFTLRSMDGRAVRTGTCSSGGTAMIEMTNLPTAIYLLQVVEETGPTTVRIIKQ